MILIVMRLCYTNSIRKGVDQGFFRRAIHPFERNRQSAIFLTVLLTKGRYQLKINSPVYGQLLFLSIVKQEGPEK